MTRSSARSQRPACVTTSTDEATGQPVVDVTHEALIRGWPELRGWINDDREQLRLHRRLSDAATDWDAGGRDEGQLYRGAPLALWDGRDESDLNELERGFLAASRERVAAGADDPPAATRITIGALAGVAAVIAAIAVFAFVQRNDATDQRDLANVTPARGQLGPRPPARPGARDAAGRERLRGRADGRGRGEPAPGRARLEDPRRPQDPGRRAHHRRPRRTRANRAPSASRARSGSGTPRTIRAAPRRSWSARRRRGTT